MIVIVAKTFRMGGITYKPEDRLSVKRDKAQQLAELGLIKSVIKPVTDKMIRSANMKKEEN